MFRALFLLYSSTVLNIGVGFRIASHTADYTTQKFFRQFDLPDYPINVTISGTDPSYYCVLFHGRVGKGLSAEGCADLPELKARGQHFWRVSAYQHDFTRRSSLGIRLLSAAA